MIIFLFIILALAVLSLLFQFNTLFNLLRDKVPYVSTPGWAISWLANNLQLTTETVYDLGCGDARVLLALKKKYPQITAIGYERNWWPYFLARLRTNGTAVTIRRANFYTADLSQATVVFCFLIHAVMPKVEKLLKAQLKPGATVYSYGFQFPNWPPAERISNPQRPQGSKINIYRA